MSDFLQEMANDSAARAAASSESFSDHALDRTVFPLCLDRFGIIAEIKNRSPAEGELAAPGGDLAARAQAYVRGGAAAISVLTEPERFAGDLSHLDAVVDAVAADGIPVMRKDFLVKPAQILEAKARGASGVLLIAAMLDKAAMASMLDCAFEHDLFVLLESFDETDLEYSAHLLERLAYREQAQRNKFLVGVNSRNLRSLAVDPNRLRRFGPRLPRRATCVAESGLYGPDDAQDVAAWGYRVALVGTALMRAAEPGSLIADMLAAGRTHA